MAKTKKRYNKKRKTKSKTLRKMRGGSVPDAWDIQNASVKKLLKWQTDYGGDKPNRMILNLIKNRLVELNYRTPGEEKEKDDEERRRMKRMKDLETAKKAKRERKRNEEERKRYRVAERRKRLEEEKQQLLKSSRGRSPGVPIKEIQNAASVPVQSQTHRDVEDVMINASGEYGLDRAKFIKKSMSELMKNCEDEKVRLEQYYKEQLQKWEASVRNLNNYKNNACSEHIKKIRREADEKVEVADDRVSRMQTKLETEREEWNQNLRREVADGKAQVTEKAKKDMNAYKELLVKEREKAEGLNAMLSEQNRVHANALKEAQQQAQKKVAAAQKQVAAAQKQGEAGNLVGKVMGVGVERQLNDQYQDKLKTIKESEEKRMEEMQQQVAAANAEAEANRKQLETINAKHKAILKKKDQEIAEKEKMLELIDFNNINNNGFANKDVFGKEDDQANVSRGNNWFANEDVFGKEDHQVDVFRGKDWKPPVWGPRGITETPNDEDPDGIGMPMLGGKRRTRHRRQQKKKVMKSRKKHRKNKRKSKKKSKGKRRTRRRR